MGIGYEHALLVTDLTWRPTKARAEAVHSTLVAWGLASQERKPELFEVEGSKSKKIAGSRIVKSGQLPDDLVLRYPPAEGEAVGRVMGPFVNEEEEWASGPGIWGGMTLVLGRDFKVLEGADYGPFGARLRGAAETYTNRDLRGSLGLAATWSSSPPATTVSLRDPRTGEALANAPARLREFTGVWRSGLWMDFDKAYPSFADLLERPRGHSLQIPGRRFVADLEGAFGAPLVEVPMFV